MLCLNVSLYIYTYHRLNSTISEIQMSVEMAAGAVCEI